MTDLHPVVTIDHDAPDHSHVRVYWPVLDPAGVSVLEAFELARVDLGRILDERGLSTLAPVRWTLFANADDLDPFAFVVSAYAPTDCRPAPPPRVSGAAFPRPDEKPAGEPVT